MVSSGLQNRKKKATRRQVLSLAGGATLALGTLGMMTFGAAATAYAQAPAATTTLTGQLTIGTPSAAPSSPTLSQSNPAAGATNNQLSFEVTAPQTVTGAAGTTPTYAAAELTLSGPYTLTTGSVAEVIDVTNGTVLGSLSSAATDQATPAAAATTTDVYASSTSGVIKSGDTLEVIIDNVANSTTVSSGDASLTLGTSTSATTPVFTAAGTSVSTASASITGPVTPTLTLSPNNNPGQLTDLTYTFQVLHPIASADTFTVDLADTPLSGVVGYPTPSTADLTLSVAGSSETSNVAATYASGTGALTLTAGANLASGVYTLSVPITGSASNPGIENVTAEYKGSSATTGSTAAFVAAPSSAAWGYPESLTSVTASDPYAGASSTVTIDFTDLDGGSTPLTVTGLGLSGNSYALATLKDTKTGANLGALVFSSSHTSTTSVSLTSGDSYSLTFTNLTLPSASTTVGIGTEFAPAASTMLSLGSAASTQMQVSASTTSPGVASNWTLSGIEAATTLTSGSTLEVSQTVASGTPGSGTYSYLPTSAGAYQIVDLSNSADTQTPSSVSVSGGEVTMTLASAVPSGDVLDVTISGVTNDPTASTATVSLIATGDYLEAAQLTPPPAASTMAQANGSIANDSGALYVWAGGYAFHLPTIPDAARIEAFAGNPAQQDVSIPGTSVFASGDTLSEGTLVQGVSGGVVQAPIYVVGSNGDLYHIASPSAFVSGGFSAKDVVQIPQRDLAEMTMAPTGSVVPSAAAAHANGAFWQASGSTAIYEWVGGVAVHVASPSDLVSIAKYMGETLMATWPQVNASTVPSSEMAPSVPMMGTVVKVLDGSTAGSMYVSTGTALVPITAAQVSSLGYPMSDVLEVSTLSGIMVL